MVHVETSCAPNIPIKKEVGRVQVQDYGFVSKKTNKTFLVVLLQTYSCRLTSYHHENFAYPYEIQFTK